MNKVPRNYKHKWWDTSLVCLPPEKKAENIKSQPVGSQTEGVGITGQAVTNDSLVTGIGYSAGTF